MTESNEDKKPAENNESLFQIMDRIIDQLNSTKKMFIIAIISIMIIPPISFAITFALLEPPSPFEGGPRERFGFGFHPFGVARIVPLMISFVWLGIGIRQWLVLSKWTKKYERYKELQKKVDEKLDFDKDEGKEG